VLSEDADNRGKGQSETVDEDCEIIAQCKQIYERQLWIESTHGVLVGKTGYYAHLKGFVEHVEDVWVTGIGSATEAEETDEGYNYWHTVYD